MKIQTSYTMPLLLVMMFSFVRCADPVELELPNSAPLFYADLQVLGESRHLFEAGVGNMYHFTERYVHPDCSILRSSIRDKSCTNLCPNSFALEIYDSTGVNVVELLENGKYSINPYGNPVEELFGFKATGGDLDAFVVQGSDVSPLVDQITVSESSIAADGEPVLKLVNDELEIIHDINFDLADPMFYMSYDLVKSGNYFSVYLDDSYNYRWDDGSAFSNRTFKIADLEAKGYVSFVMKDFSGKLLEATINIKDLSCGDFEIYSGFRFYQDFVYQEHGMDVLMINLIYTDDSGNEYESYFADQDLSSSFNFTNIGDFADNELGESTFKLDFDFRVNLYDINSGGHLCLERGSGSFAFLKED